MTLTTFLILAILCFLHILNLHLRGARKQTIQIILFLLIMLTIGFSFFLSEWWYGIISILLVFVFSAIFRPFASALSYKILGFRTGIDDNQFSNDSYERLLYKMENYENLEDLVSFVDNNKGQTTEKLKKIYKNKKVNGVLEKHNVSFEDFEIWFSKLQIGIPDLAIEILSSPIELEKLFELKNNNASDEDVFIYFRNNRRTKNR